MGGVENMPGGTHRSVFSGRLRGIGRNIFKLECHHADSGGKAAHGVQIIVRRFDLQVGYLACGRVLIGRIGVHPIPHPPRGDGEHTAKLSAAQHADGGSRKDGRCAH